MVGLEPSKIRNVAVVGHRGTGKTSLVEAMLFQAGATNRLGSVEQATTVADWDEDEHRRQMSLSAALCHLEWQGRKINLIDTPGDPGFQADTLAALRVVEGALMVVSGVAGVEVQTTRLWDRCEQLGLSRLLFVNMLDRERADFFTTLEQLRGQLSDRCVAVQIPIGQEHELTGVVDLFHMRAYMSPEGEREGDPVDIPAEIADQAAEYREKLVDSVVETDEALMERYLEEGEVTGEELAAALKNAVVRDELFPVGCGVATKNLGTTGMLDLLVEAVPSPAKEAKPVDVPRLEFPEPVMSFAITPKAKGDEEKMATALRRLAEEDPTLVLRRDEQTGEQLLAGLSQIHVEVAVERMRRRFGIDVELHQPRVPYLETIRKESKAQG